MMANSLKNRIRKQQNVTENTLLIAAELHTTLQENTVFKRTALRNTSSKLGSFFYA